MLQQTYNWQRYWCELGGNVKLSDQGFLFNPGPYNPEIVSFGQIADIPCLAFLGEPGIGKSRTIEVESSALRDRFQDKDDRAFLFDLRAYRSEERLVRSLFQSKEFTEWVDGSHRLHLFLDSLDECLLRIDTVAGLLVEEFKKYPVKRLFLRVACRSAEWPSLLTTELGQIWGREQFKRYELVQLRYEDAVHAAAVKGLDANAFMRQVEIRDAGPFAAKPVTLRFLLNLFELNNRLPGTKDQLYETGCRILCGEENESRVASGLKGTLNPTEKMVVAARVAAITTLANRAAVWIGPDLGDVAREDVTIRELSGWTEQVSGLTFEVTEKCVKEALSTGLFTSRQEDRLGWVHQTYAEYLTAWYFRHIGLDFKRVMWFLTHQNYGAGRKLVPQLYETAAWTANLIPQVFEEIMRIDPDVLLRSDVGSLNPRYRQRLVGALLKLFEDEKANDDLGLHSRYKYLEHSKLGEQLRPYLTDPSRGWLVRRVATDIAEECEVKELKDDFLKIVLDDSEDITMRGQAANALCKIGDLQTKAKLKNIAIQGVAEDTYQELKGYALTAVWPHSLSAEELFASLIEPRESFLGSYYLFLSRYLMDGLQPKDLRTALEWVAKQEATGMSLSLGGVADEIMLCAWEHLHNDSILEAFATAAWSKLTRHQDLLGARGFMPIGESMKLFMVDKDKRRRVLAQMLQKVREPQKDWLWFTRSQALRIFEEDIEWLVEQYAASNSILTRQAILQIFQRVFNNEVKSEYLTALAAVRDANERLREELDPLFVVYLGTPEAELSRRNFQLIAEYEQQREAEQSPLLDPPPGERVETLLKRFENGESEVWPRITKELTLEPRSTHYSVSFEADLTGTPVWLGADEKLRSRLLAAAKNYLEVGDPMSHEWFGSNTFYESALAGYQSLLLVLGEDACFLDELSQDVWKKWMPIIIAYPRTSGADDVNTARHRALITTAYKRASVFLTENLFWLLDKANASKEYFSLSREYDGCWDVRFGEAVLEKAQNPNLKPNHVGNLLDKLLEKDVKGSREFAASLITTPVPQTGEARELAIIAARQLMAYSPDAGWPIIWPAIQQDAAFGRAVSESWEYVLRAGRGSLFAKLGEDSLADYYLWLCKQYPHHEDPKSEGMHLVGPRESVAQWRDSLLTYLKGSGTRAAAAAIERIVLSLPELDWLKFVLIEARKTTLTRSWVPLDPKSILSLLRQERAVKKLSLEDLLQHPFFLTAVALLGVVLALVGYALEFGSKPSPMAAAISVAVSWPMLVAAVYLLTRIGTRSKRYRLTLTGVFGLVSCGVLLLFCWWLLRPVGPNAVPEKSEKSAPIQMPSALASPTPSPAETPQPSITPTPVTNKKRKKAR